LTLDVAAPPPLPVTSPAVAVWWAGLSDTSRRKLSAASALGSGLRLGAVDGIPGRIRDEINRRRLHLALQAAEHAPRSGGWSRDLLGTLSRPLPWPLSGLDSLSRLFTGESTANSRLRALKALTLTIQQPGSELLAFDASGEGQAVVASGDVDSGRSVAVLVPGLGTELADVPALARGGTRLAGAAGAATVAVAWLGYDAPGLIQVVTDTRARSGAGRLRTFVNGLRSSGLTRQRLTVIGHSYGSLVAGIAARRDLPVDELVLLASPGVEADRASQLRIEPGHVWAARDGTDPIQVVFWPSRLGRMLGLPVPTVFGPDPVSAAFGAHHFDTGGAYGHSGYFASGSRSLDNLGRIVSGRPTVP
jgi:pimeloyl-ACP methyl ester carboxylesterase